MDNDRRHDGSGSTRAYAAYRLLLQHMGGVFGRITLLGKIETCLRRNGITVCLDCAKDLLGFSDREAELAIELMNAPAFQIPFGSELPLLLMAERSKAGL